MEYSAKIVCDENLLIIFAKRSFIYIRQQFADDQTQLKIHSGITDFHLQHDIPSFIFLLIWGHNPEDRTR